MKAKVILLAAKQNTVLRGHPWIFPKAIARYTGKPITGHLVDIHTNEGELIGIGVYNEHSLYRVRVLGLASEPIESNDYKPLIRHRLQQAKKVRECLLLPSQTTTAYRLFNSEADGLSGLTIDRFNQFCVVSSSAYWVELNKKLITEALQELFPDDHIIWMAQSKPLAQDGWKETAVREAHRTTQVMEGGVIYQVEFASAQKTGLFLDQRENHIRMAEFSKGKKVLDLYTYSGGFALHAARAGALHVTAVDSSEQAIAQGKSNASLNSLTKRNLQNSEKRMIL